MEVKYPLNTKGTSLGDLGECFWVAGGAIQTDGSPMWARLITEQWLLFWSQNGSFSFICVVF